MKRVNNFTSNEIMTLFNLISKDFVVKNIRISPQDRCLEYYLGSYFDTEIYIVLSKYYSYETLSSIKYGIHICFSGEINERYPFWNAPDEEYILLYDKRIRNWIKKHNPKESKIWKYTENFNFLLDISG